ncbi:MAG: PAS domain S-box protein, partial [Thermodesulfobacteriota bacterium]
LYFDRAVEKYPGWRVAYLVRPLDLLDPAPYMVLKALGLLILFSCGLIGVEVYLLYRSASAEMDHRRAIEAALAESEERFRSIVENSHAGIIIVGRDYRFGYANDEAGRLLGLPAREVIGRDFREFLDDESRRLVTEYYHRRQRGQEVPSHYEFNVITSGGEKRRVEISSSIITDSRGHVHTVGQVLDITERKATEEALRESEERYRKVLEANPDPMVVYDMEGRVLYFNPAFAAVFGWTLEESLGRKMDHFVPDLAWPETRRMIQRVLNRESFQGVETVRFNKSGELIPVSISAACFSDKEGRLLGSVINIRDVRQQKNLESQLQQAQKMEAVGTLASGIAHDFNNLLQAISGYVQLILSKGGPTLANRRYLAEVDHTVQRAKDLVQRLLHFSRKMKTEPRPVDLNREVIYTVGMLERTIPKMIRIETRLAGGLWPIEGDPSQLEQVLMNLGVNAMDAMPDGGRMTVETGNTTLDENFCRDHLGLTPGDYVLLRVTDTGLGMDAETLQHIFEPFYTTKPVGQGTGLGLFTVYGIVQAHGGQVLCHSRVGEGTVFDLYFPVLGDRRAEIAAGPESAEAVQGHGETVLVVDDEPAVREIAREVLADNGYRVLEAGSGEEALEIYGDRRGSIDLVVLDLGMPGMGGSACLKELLVLDPEAKVLIASGYSNDSPVRRSLEDGARGFIGKPYRLVDILKKVRQVLDAKDK